MLRLFNSFVSIFEELVNVHTFEFIQEDLPEVVCKLVIVKNSKPKSEDSQQPERQKCETKPTPESTKEKSAHRVQTKIPLFPEQYLSSECLAFVVRFNEQHAAIFDELCILGIGDTVWSVSFLIVCIVLNVDGKPDKADWNGYL